jgi:hypothetical protein
VAQLLGAVHRVDRHHHRIGAQDGVIGDHELRAVLRVEQHALAARDAVALLQEAGERIDLTLELGVGDAAAVVVDRGALRISRGAARQVFIDRLFWKIQRFRLAGRPVGEMPGERHNR